MRSNGTKLIAIVGPTASGKTNLALSLARKFNGEIISADSRQIYKYLNIGTDKINGTWRTYAGKRTYIAKGIPHHLIDVWSPKKIVTAAEWKRAAETTIRAIAERGHLPIVAGGTGLYVRALLDDFTFPAVAPNDKLRARLEKQLTRNGLELFAKKILARDPAAAAFLDIKNPRRLIRALEVMEITGRPFSELRTRPRQSPWDSITIGLTPSKKHIETNIRKRLQRQFSLGLEKEARILFKRYGTDAPALATIGYSEWKPFLSHKKLSFRQKNIVFENIFLDTRHYSKRQMTWFRKDKNIIWIDAANASKASKRALRLTKDFLNKKSA